MTCNKIGYATREEALQDRRFITNQQRHFKRKRRDVEPKKTNQNYKRMRVYYCERCQQWHLTTAKQKRKW